MSLSDRIVGNIKHYKNKYISDKELKEKILLKNPVPTNIRVHQREEEQ